MDMFAPELDLFGMELLQQYQHNKVMTHSLDLFLSDLGSNIMAYTTQTSG
jgi:hypothetical protein